MTALPVQSLASRSPLEQGHTFTTETSTWSGQLFTMQRFSDQVVNLGSSVARLRESTHVKYSFVRYANKTMVRITNDL